MEITCPTLLVDEDICRRNIDWMLARARLHGIRLRPHFKTHQSRAIAGWFRDRDVSQIAVSSVKMADYFIAAGFEDVTIAFPVNLRELDQIDRLAERASLSCLVESEETLRALEEGLFNRIGVLVKIDTGFRRTGIPAEDTDMVEQLLARVDRADKLMLRGLLTHAGQSYEANTRQDVLSVHRESASKMRALKALYRARWPELEISVGDTPTCSLAEEFDGIDEIRPGNFVFYDVMQCQIGSCDYDRIAVALACPVVARHPARNEIVIHGGAVHLSKDFIFDSGGKRAYGRVVRLATEPGQGWGAPIRGARVVSLSQEHGVVSVPAPHFDEIQVGDVIGVLPVHACLTADCMGGYTSLTGEKIDHLAGAE